MTVERLSGDERIRNRLRARTPLTVERKNPSGGGGRTRESSGPDHTSETDSLCRTEEWDDRWEFDRREFEDGRELDGRNFDRRNFDRRDFDGWNLERE